MSDFDQMAEATAANLSQAASSAAYELFCDQAFRRMAGFERLSQAEQDRIFNELVVAFLALVMLLLEAPDLRVAAELRSYFAELKKRIPAAYMEQLRSLGVEALHLHDWEKLISLRYEEYALDKHEVRSAAMQIEATEKPLDLEGLSKIQLFVPVQAVAIGCHHHVCRGNTAGEDDLFKRVLNSLSKFYVEFRIRLEGGKITPLTRTRAAVRRMLRRLGRE